MRLSVKVLITFFLFSILFMVSANAQTAIPIQNNNGYSVNGIDLNNLPNEVNKNATTGADTNTSFWNLPLWIQITYISLIAMTAIALVKAFPFILSRLKHALENPKTKEIFYFIQRNPGMTISKLSEEQNINRGTLKYHLSQLFSNNKIMLIRRGKVSLLYHKTLTPMDKENVIASYIRRDDKSPAILFTIMDNPGITNKSLSEQFRLDKSTITDYLKKFLDDDLIEFRHDGKFKRCYLKQDVRMIILRYRPQ